MLGARGVLGREGRAGVGGRDDEVDLLEGARHRVAGLDAHLLGHGRDVQVVHRLLRDTCPNGDFVGEVAAHPGHLSPRSASSVARLPIAHCAARFGKVMSTSTSTMPVSAMQLLRFGADAVFDAGLERGAAEVRDRSRRACR